MNPTEETTQHWVWAHNASVDHAGATEDSVGKWMIFRSADQIDAAWAIIHQAVGNGRLWRTAKAASARPAAGGKHVICIYTPRSEDETNCRLYLAALRDLGFRDRLYYKPDAWTRAGRSGSLYRS